MIKCRFEHGSVAFLRHVTVGGLVVRANKLLLVKRSEKSQVEAGKWCLPGGYLDRDESAAQAVVREILEETGYESEVITIFRIVDRPRMKGDDRQNIDFIYLVRAYQQVQSPDYEVEEVRWFELDELPHPNEVAFDHYDSFRLLIEHKQNPHILPLFN